jgi:hypothetical protein
MSGRILEDHRLRVMQQSNRQLGVFGYGWVGCCNSPKSGGIERTEARGGGRGITWYHQLLGKKEKGRRRQRTSTQRDIEDKVLRLKEFVDVAVAGRVI